MELKEIEQKYNVQTLTYKGNHIWPLVRLKLNEEIRAVRNIQSRTFKLRWNIILKLLRTATYGLKKLCSLRKYGYWIFSSSDRRKKTQNGTYEDRVVGFAAHLWQDSLIIENPYPLGKHYKKNEVYPDEIISQTIFSLAVRTISIFLQKPKVENEPLLKKIFDDLGVQINYVRVIKEVRAQYMLGRFLLKFSRPKVVIFVYSASSMGFIKAFKEAGIPVVEIQHGVINESHYAYNIYKDFGNDFFPDYLFTYGKRECSIFHKENFFIDDSKVFPVGYYFLEMAKKNKESVAKAKMLKQRFKKIVAFSLQDPFDSFNFGFLDQVAALDPMVGYLLVPRNPIKLYDQFKTRPNVIIERDLNIYECLAFADYHSTINSTCAIESLCFGVPNILYNYDGWAWRYYSNVLKDSGHTVFVDSADEFIATLNRQQFFPREKIKKAGALFFEDNFLQNVKRIVETEILTEGYAE